MKPAFAILIIIAVLTTVASKGAPSSVPVELPRFEGYSTIGQATYFALSIRRNEKLVGQGWLSIGESIAGFRLEGFDRPSEVLTVRDSGGREHALKLPAATFGSSTASTDAAIRSAAAKAKALVDIEAFRKRGIDIFGPATVVVDTDGSLLPESRRKNYPAYRASSEAKGQIFLPVNVDGRWYNTFTPTSPPADSQSREARAINNPDLTPQDAEEIRLRWLIAKAEFMARDLAAPPGTLKAKTGRPPK